MKTINTVDKGVKATRRSRSPDSGGVLICVDVDVDVEKRGCREEREMSIRAGEKTNSQRFQAK